MHLAHWMSELWIQHVDFSRHDIRVRPLLSLQEREIHLTGAHQPYNCKRIKKILETYILLFCGIVIRYHIYMELQ